MSRVSEATAKRTAALRRERRELRRHIKNAELELYCLRDTANRFKFDADEILRQRGFVQAAHAALDAAGAPCEAQRIVDGRPKIVQLGLAERIRETIPAQVPELCIGGAPAAGAMRVELL